jgi:hypothetical protein
VENQNKVQMIEDRAALPLSWARFIRSSYQWLLGMMNFFFRQIIGTGPKLYI